jgi:RND family efflux transporter MFP subunit
MLFNLAKLVRVARPLMLATFLAIEIAGPGHADSPLLVDSVRVQSKPAIETFSLSGEIVARDAVGLSFPMGGRILLVTVREGDKVKQGQILAQLESVQQEQALLSAEAALTATKADLRQAEEEFKRQEAFLERGATTRIRRDEAERLFYISKANIERANAELDRARKAYDDTFLRAPESGVIIDRLADPGEVLSAAHPVLELALGEAFDAVFNVPELLPAKLPDDFTVSLTLIENPEVTFSGQVRKVSPLVDSKSGTVEVSVGVDTPPSEVSYGDAVRARITRPVPPRMTIPYTALVAYKDGAAVWIIDPETLTVALVPITLAQHLDGLAIVSGGLEESALVVTSGAQLLYPGRSIKLKVGE